MGVAAARRSGAPSLPVRALSSLLAAVLTLVPLTLLLMALSTRVAEALRSQSQLVDFIPLPVPPPPEVPPPQPARASSRPAPASLPAPAPIPLPQVPVNPVPAPAAASPLDGFAAGSGTGPANGTGGGDIGAGAPRAARTPAGWVVMPTNQELARFDPPKARREHVSGAAVLSCRVLRIRRVTDCRVIEEKPRNYGFGKAALGASAIFQMNPPTQNGDVDEQARIEIPVAFNERSRRP
jgi:protein TonB